MNIYFSGDWHLNHANCILYEKRPFIKEGDLINGKWASHNIATKRVLEMNSLIINRCNQRVKEDDLLILNGDVGFKSNTNRGEGEPQKPQELLSKLQCKNIIIISGNHDKACRNGLKSVIEKMIIKHGGQRICIVHNPEHCEFKYKINLTAHVHNLWKIKRYFYKNNYTDCINIGVDVWDFYPVTWNEINARYCRWLKAAK